MYIYILEVAPHILWRLPPPAFVASPPSSLPIHAIFNLKLLLAFHQMLQKKIKNANLTDFQAKIKIIQPF